MTKQVAEAVDAAVGPASELLTVEETAAFYRVPVKTIYSWHATGRGPKAYRVGRYLRFRRSDVLAHLESRAIG